MPKAASTRETEVRAVTALSRDGNVSLPEVFVGNDGSSRQLYDNGVVMPVGWTGASTRRRTGSKFTGTLLASTEFPVGDAGANPQRIKPFSRKTWLQGVRDDIRKRSPLYAQDWFDGLRNPAKSAGALMSAKPSDASGKRSRWAFRSNTGPCGRSARTRCTVAASDDACCISAVSTRFGKPRPERRTGRAV